jgi:hypothetical protein
MLLWVKFMEEAHIHFKKWTKADILRVNEGSQEPLGEIKEPRADLKRVIHEKVF